MSGRTGGTPRITERKLIPTSASKIQITIFRQVAIVRASWTVWAVFLTMGFLKTILKTILCLVPHHKNVQGAGAMYTLHTTEFNVARRGRARDQRNGTGGMFCQARYRLWHQSYYLLCIYHTQMQVWHQRERPPSLSRAPIQNNRSRLRYCQRAASQHP